MFTYAITWSINHGILLAGSQLATLEG